MVRDDLAGSSWHDRLELVALRSQDARLAGLKVYRLNGRLAAVQREGDQDRLAGNPASAGGWAPDLMTGPLSRPDPAAGAPEALPRHLPS